MSSREFCYWLQGYFELNQGITALTNEQSDLIRKHLAMVFVHEIDPSYPNGEKLDKIHGAPVMPPPLSIKKMIVTCKSDGSSIHFDADAESKMPSYGQSRPRC